MSEYTAGPWEMYHQAPMPHQSFPRGGYRIAGGSEITICKIADECKQDEANARLIAAAAPELLEACRDLSHLAAILSGRQHAGLPIAPVMWSMLDGLTNKADAAIAKVEGIE